MGLQKNLIQKETPSRVGHRVPPEMKMVKHVPSDALWNQSYQFYIPGLCPTHPI